MTYNSISCIPKFLNGIKPFDLSLFVSLKKFQVLCLTKFEIDSFFWLDASRSASWSAALTLTRLISLYFRLWWWFMLSRAASCFLTGLREPHLPNRWATPLASADHSDLSWPYPPSLLAIIPHETIAALAKYRPCEVAKKSDHYQIQSMYNDFYSISA